MEVFREPARDWERERELERRQEMETLFREEFFKRPLESFPNKPLILPEFLRLEMKNSTKKNIKFSYKNNYLSKFPDTFIRKLEEELVNQRVDDFVARAARIPLRDVPQRPAIPGPLTERYFESRTGLRATSHMRASRPITAKGEEVLAGGERYTEVHFTPGGRTRFDPRRMTDSLARGIQGVIEMVEAVDQGKFDADQVLAGMTNINMALIAQRLGFVIVDSSRTPTGEIDKRASSFTVVGRLDNVRAKVEEFKVKGTPQKLIARNDRQGAPRMIPEAAR